MKTGFDHNSVFAYIIVGALMSASAIAWLFTRIPRIDMLRLSDAVTPLVLAAGSLYLLYKAAKNDRNRLNEV